MPRKWKKIRREKKSKKFSVSTCVDRRTVLEDESFFPLAGGVVSRNFIQQLLKWSSELSVPYHESFYPTSWTGNNGSTDTGKREPKQEI